MVPQLPALIMEIRVIRVLSLLWLQVMVWELQLLGRNGALDLFGACFPRLNDCRNNLVSMNLYLCPAAYLGTSMNKF